MNINVLGYCLKDKSIHVCGYENNKILFQVNGGKMRKSLVRNDIKGFYFNSNNKKIRL